jgi:plastocyanin
MKKGFALLAGSAVLALAAGCGSSSNSSSATTSAGSATTSTGAIRSGSVKVGANPKYAAPAASAPVQSGVVQIAYRNIAIDPDTLKVKVGSTIRWTNYDPVEHNVTSKGGPITFASKTFGEGGTFEVKATKAGTIHYVCTIHPTTMNGTIEVVK